MLHIKLCSECLNEWNIYNKVVGITTDAGGNMKVGAQLLGWEWFSCIAHKLHNTIKAVLESVEDILSKGRALLNHFKHSPLHYSKLR